MLGVHELKHHSEIILQPRQAKSEGIFWLYIFFDIIIFVIIFVLFAKDELVPSMLGCIAGRRFISLFVVFIAVALDGTLEKTA